MKKLLVGLVVIIGLIALAPLGTKSAIDDKIDERKVDLKDNGLFLEIKSNTGYLKSTREFNLTIEDVDLFKDFIQQSIIRKYPSYKSVIDTIFAKEDKQVNEFLSGLVFVGDITNSNIDYNSDVQTNIYLKSFSSEIMKSINSKKELKEMIIPLLDKKALGMHFIHSPKGYLKTAEIKDINESFKIKDKNTSELNVNYQLLGYSFKNRSRNKVFSGDIDLEKMKLTLDAKEKVDFILEDMSYDFDYVNEYQSSATASLKSFVLNAKDDKLSISDISIFGKANIKDKLYFTNAKFVAKDINVLAKNQSNSISSLTWDFNLSDIDFNSIKELNDSYIKLQAVSTNTNLSDEQRVMLLQQNSQPMVASFQKLLNNGLKLKTNFEIKNLKNEQINMDFVKIDLDAEVEKNSLDVIAVNNFTLLNVLNAKANIKLPKKDLDGLLKIINPNMAMMISMHAKEVNSDVVFDIVIKKGIIKINDKKIN